MKREDRTLIPIAKDVHKEFKLYCVQNDLVMTGLVTQLIKEYLEEQK